MNCIRMHNKSTQPKIADRCGCLFFYKFEDVGNFAVQRVAKGIKRFGIDRLPLFHTVQGIGGKALLEDQIIFGYAFFK